MSTYLRRNAIRFLVASVLLSLFLTGTLVLTMSALNATAQTNSGIQASAAAPASLYSLPKSPYPASTLYVVGGGGQTSPLGFTVAALQGIVARTQPQIFITFNSQDQAWLQSMQKTYGINVQKSSAQQVLQQFKSVVSDSSGNIKIVVFDSNDAVFPMQVNIATTLAGVYTALPVSSNDLPAINSLFSTKINILYDLRGKFADKVSGYSWLWNLVGPQVTKQFVVMAPEGKVPLTDYIVEFKAFDFEFCCVSAGQHATLTASEQSLADRIFANYAPLTPVLGFFGLGGESATINYLSLHGMSATSSDEASDLSVYSGLPDLTNLHQVAENTIAYNPSKVYVLWQFTQGDALMYDYYNNYAQWLAVDPVTNQPYRNEIAATWQLNPMMAEISPPILQGWYATQSALDDFITGPSGGAGYVHPDNMPNEAAFLNQVATLSANAGMGTQFVIFQSLSTSVYQNYINYAHPSAILLWQNNGRASQVVNGVPVMTSSFWESAGYSYVPGDVTTAISQIQNSGKFVYVIMNAQNPGFPFIQQVMNKLGSNYVAVSAGQYTNLYLQSMGVSTTSSSSHTTTTQSTTTHTTLSSSTTTHSTSSSHTTSTTQSTTSPSTTSHSSSTTPTTSTTHSISTSQSTTATSSISDSSHTTSSTSGTIHSTSATTSIATNSTISSITSPTTSETTNSTTSSITTPTTSETNNSTSLSVSRGSTSSVITSSVSTQPATTTTSQSNETTSQVVSRATTSSTATSNQSSTTTVPFRTVNGISSGSVFAPSGQQPAALFLGTIAAFGIFFLGKMGLRVLKQQDRVTAPSIGWRW